MTQPASEFVPRHLVRVVPFSTPAVQVGSLPSLDGFGFGFDVGLALSDRNQLGYSAQNASFPNIATGFFLDVSAFSDQASTLDVLLKANTTATARSVMTGGVPLVVPASTLTLVAGLRVIGSFVTVTLTNTAGVAANIVLFAAVRSA